MEHEPETSVPIARLKEILETCMVDAMNRYVNQVLIPAGLISEDAWRATPTGSDSPVCVQKHEIATSIAEKWTAALNKRE